MNDNSRVPTRPSKYNEPYDCTSLQKTATKLETPFNEVNSDRKNDTTAKYVNERLPSTTLCFCTNPARQQHVLASLP